MTIRDRVRQWLGFEELKDNQLKLSTDQVLLYRKFSEINFSKEKHYQDIIELIGSVHKKTVSEVAESIIHFQGLQGQAELDSYNRSVADRNVAANRQAEVMQLMQNILGQVNSSNTCAEDRHGELIEILTKLEHHFVSKHVGRPTTSIPVYDWEQVQIQELAEMLANPPKEEN